MRFRLLGLTLLFLPTLACSPSGSVTPSEDGGTDAGRVPIRASDYDQSCATVDDCALISEGDACGCNFPNAAINRRDVARESADYAARSQGCPPIGCGAPAETYPLCFKGKCAAYACDFPGCHDAGPSAECASDDDCPGTKLCVGLRCLDACTADADCGGGTCEHDRCHQIHGCNGTFPSGTACPAVCLGVCRSGAADAGAD